MGTSLFSLLQLPESIVPSFYSSPRPHSAHSRSILVSLSVVPPNWHSEVAGDLVAVCPSVVFSLPTTRVSVPCPLNTVLLIWASVATCSLDLPAPLEVSSHWPMNPCSFPLYPLQVWLWFPLNPRRGFSLGSQLTDPNIYWIAIYKNSVVDSCSVNQMGKSFFPSTLLSLIWLSSGTVPSSPHLLIPKYIAQSINSPLPNALRPINH